MYVRLGGAIAASGRRLAAVVLPAALLAAGCGGGDGDGAPADCTFASERDNGASGRDDGPVNRDDVDGDGHADVVANGWYRVQGDPGTKWRNNRFVLRAAGGGPDPSAAFPLGGCYPPHGPASQYPVGHDFSVQLTGDLDDDGYADVLVRGVRGPDGSDSGRQRILWGGPDGPVAATDLPEGADPAAGVGDFDGDGALDLLTLAVPAGESPRAAQPATVLRGPLSRLSRAGARPRSAAETDVGFGGWASITDVLVGDFDGDGRDDLVTKATYDEEDVRFEEGMPDEVIDAALYRGTPGGLRLAGAVPGVTSGSRNGTTPLAAGDFDDDGTDDIVARGEYGDAAIVVHGSPQGPGAGRKTTGLDRPVGLGYVVGDVNGDGTDDLATSHSPSGEEGEVAVTLGGAGGLAVDGTQVVVPQDVGAKPGLRRNADHFFGWQLYLADLDTDGDDDLVVGTFRAGEPPEESGYWIFRGTPEGTSVADRDFVTTEDAG